MLWTDTLGTERTPRIGSPGPRGGGAAWHPGCRPAGMSLGRPSCSVRFRPCGSASALLGAILALHAGLAALQGEDIQPSAKPGASAPSGPRAEVETVDARIDVDGPSLTQLALRADAARPRSSSLSIPGRSFPIEDLLFLRLYGEPSSPGGPASPAAGPKSTLLLQDGCELVGSVTAGDEDSVTWLSTALGDEPLKLSLDDVRGLLISPEGISRRGAPEIGSRTSKDHMLSRSLYQEILGSRASRDTLVLLEGSRVEGILGSLLPDGVRFSSESLGDVKIGFDKIRALILAKLEPAGSDGPPAPAGERKDAGGGGTPSDPPASPDPFEVRVGLRNGSLLSARLRDITAGGMASGVVRLDGRLLGARQVSLGEVSEIAFLGGRATYLSDMEPLRVNEDSGPLFRSKTPHRKDASVLGTPIRLGGRTYRKGLGVHSYSLLEYALGGRYATFRATIGLDDTARPPSDAVGTEGMARVDVRVRLDGKLIFEKTLSYRDAPVPVDLPVRGGQVLSLEVDYGGAGGSFNLSRDRFDWADARVVR